MTESKRAAFAALYELYFSKVYRYVYGSLLNRAAAEDVTAEVFFAALASFDRYDETRGSAAAWLGTIARNKVRNYFKNAHVRHEILGEEIEPQETWEDCPFDAVDGLRNPDDQKLCRILRKLAPEERELLELRFGFELTYEEIAKLLGIRVDAAQKRGGRLLEKCRRLAGEQA